MLPAFTLGSCIRVKSQLLSLNRTEEISIEELDLGPVELVWRPMGRVGEAWNHGLKQDSSNNWIQLVDVLPKSTKHPDSIHLEHLGPLLRRYLVFPAEFP